MRQKKILIKIIPIISIGITILFQIFLSNSSLHPTIRKPFFTYFLIISLIIYFLFFILSFFNVKLDTKITYKSYFIAGVFIFLNILNILTVKLAVLPVLYFPALDRVIAVFIDDRNLLIKCLLYSFRLLSIGYISGVIAGLITGISIGFNKRISYWLSPVIRVLGPIPSTAWIPIVLVSFPTAVSASTFLIALAVWFPVTLMTSSGISNVKNVYFEVSDTLGASTFSKIFKIGVPAAMPHIFLGLFNGTCSSFITLVTAEMIGAKYGIGWYTNWQKEMLAYSNVYAGLIITAVVFSILITILFKVRDKILGWQKGVIKW